MKSYPNYYIKSEEFMHASLQLAKVGTWILNLKTLKCVFSNEAFEILGVEGEQEQDIKKMLSCFTGDSQQKIVSEIKQMYKKSMKFSLDLESNEHKTIRFWGESKGLNNKIDLVSGAFQDISQDRKKEKDRNDYISRLEKVVLQQNNEIERLQKINNELNPKNENKTACQDDLTESINLESLLRQERAINILLAEDSDLIRAVTKELVERAGISIDLAANGQEAIRLFRENEYDLILMDIEMPVMDGLEATRKIRALAAGEKVPIIAMTTKVLEEDLINSKKAGMCDHLAKPVEPEELYQMIIKWITEEKNDVLNDAAYLKHPLSDLNEAIVEKQQLEKITRMGGIDTNRGIRSVGGNLIVYLNILKQFSKQHRNDSILMLHKLGVGDFTWISERAHGIKGIAATLGIKHLQKQAFEVEQMFKRNKITDREYKTLNIFCDSLNEVIEKLAKILTDREEVRSPQLVESKTKGQEKFEYRWNKLISLLRSNDTEAIEVFSELKKEMRIKFQDDINVINEMENNLKMFDFEIVVQLMEELKFN